MHSPFVHLDGSDELSNYNPSALRTKLGDVLKMKATTTNAWTLTGEANYLSHVCREDLVALKALFKNILFSHPDVARVQNQIAMGQFQADISLPIPSED